MKKLGVIGGMGPLCTASFYRKITEKTKASCDQDHIPMVILSDNQMPDRTAAILDGKDEEILLRKIKEDIDTLEKLEVANIAIPCNTMHYYMDYIEKNSKTNVINMVYETLRYCKGKGHKKIAVLGTYATMNCGIYERYADEFGIEIISLTEEEKKLSMDVIYRIKETADTKADDFINMAQDLNKAGVNGIILACTELSIIDGIGSYEYIIDAMDVLAIESIKQMGYELK